MRRRRAATSEPSSGPAGWRTHLPGPRPARAGRGLADRADLWPDRGRIRSHGPPDRRGARVIPSSAGRALPGVELRIVAPDAAGIGEIEVRSAALFDGYLGDEAATAAAMTADGWLRTGDLGSLDDDGWLTVADRRTDRIVRGGENISPSEVEAVLLDHPAIADAGVVARRDAEFGHVAVAAIVLRSGRHRPRRRGADRLLPATVSPGSRCRPRSSGSRRCRGPRTASSGGPNFAPVSIPSSRATTGSSDPTAPTSRTARSVTGPATSCSFTARCRPLRSSAAWPGSWPPRAR